MHPLDEDTNRTGGAVRLLILHFDDQPETVSMIPGKLYNDYRDQRHDWIVPDSVKRDLNVTKFGLRPPARTGAAPPEYLIEYRTIERRDDFLAALSDLKEAGGSLLDNAIVVCDIFCATTEATGLEAAGHTLYMHAKDEIGVDESRMLILSGFTNWLRGRHPEITFPEACFFEKPVVPAVFADALVSRFPPAIRLPQAP